MKQKILFEIIWLLITLIVVCLVQLPIYLDIGTAYPFYFDNSMFIILAITFMRYIFLLKHHWIVYSKWFKIILIFVPIIILFYLVDALYNFQLFCDQEGVKSIMNEQSYETQSQMSKFIRTEMLFFWVAAFIGNLLMPFRMILSLWRKMNKGME